jgi:hypothetical protein
MNIQLMYERGEAPKGLDDEELTAVKKTLI